MQVCILRVSMTNHMLQSVFCHVDALQSDSTQSTDVLDVTLTDDILSFSFFITLLRPVVTTSRVIIQCNTVLDVL